MERAAAWLRVERGVVFWSDGRLERQAQGTALASGPDQARPGQVYAMMRSEAV